MKNRKKKNNSFWTEKITRQKCLAFYALIFGNQNSRIDKNGNAPKKFKIKILIILKLKLVKLRNT